MYPRKPEGHSAVLQRRRSASESRREQPRAAASSREQTVAGAKELPVDVATHSRDGEEEAPHYAHS